MIKKKLKLHLGNGTVYLDGWVNIDYIGKLAKDHPKLTDHCRTTIKKYYKFPFRANRDNNVTDIHLDVKNLSIYKDSTVDEILCVNLIDHMRRDDFIKKALPEWKRVLKPGGKLIIDIDDRVQQANVLAKANSVDEITYGLRLIYCDQVSKGRTHYWGYNPEYLKSILLQEGFKYIWTKTDYIVHDYYPNFQICVQK